MTIRTECAEVAAEVVIPIAVDVIYLKRDRISQPGIDAAEALPALFL